MIPIFLVPAAEAHRPGLSYARIDGDTLSLTFARPELGMRLPVADLDAARVIIADATIDKASVTASGVPCEIGDPTVRDVQGDGIEIFARLDCPAGTRWQFTAAYLSDFEPGHRHYLEAAGQPIAVLDAGNPVVEFASLANRTDVAKQFLGLGVEHIWTGYDHLLFLFGLLLTAPTLRTMLLIVTGFTIAHSITLTLAALEIVHLPPGVVEPAIALSILWVGIENLWKPPARRRVLLTFLLGLIHGFGFAGLLIELGLPRTSLVLALFSFNGGVELGQAAIVAGVLPLFLWLRRFGWWEAKAIPALSVGVASAGAFWFIQRVFFDG